MLVAVNLEELSHDVGVIMDVREGGTKVLTMLCQKQANKVAVQPQRYIINSSLKR